MPNVLSEIATGIGSRSKVILLQVALILPLLAILTPNNALKSNTLYAEEIKTKQTEMVNEFNASFETKGVQSFLILVSGEPETD